MSDPILARPFTITHALRAQRCHSHDRFARGPAFRGKATPTSASSDTLSSIRQKTVQVISQRLEGRGVLGSAVTERSIPYLLPTSHEDVCDDVLEQPLVTPQVDVGRCTLLRPSNRHTSHTGLTVVYVRNFVLTTSEASHISQAMIEEGHGYVDKPYDGWKP